MSNTQPRKWLQTCDNELFSCTFLEVSATAAKRVDRFEFRWLVQSQKSNILQFGSKNCCLNKYSHPTKWTTAKIVCPKTYITVDTVESLFYCI